MGAGAAPDVLMRFLDLNSKFQGFAGSNVSKASKPSTVLQRQSPVFNLETLRL
jgi:hypothetical protein